MWAVPPLLFIVVIVVPLTVLFAIFGLRTLHRHSLRVAVSDEAIACRGAATKIIPWHELSVLKLRYFGSRRSKWRPRSEEHTSELQSLMRNSYAVFCLKKKKTRSHKHQTNTTSA